MLSAWQFLRGSRKTFRRCPFLLHLFLHNSLKNLHSCVVLVIRMGLTNKKEEQLKKMPLIETKISKSRDGKYLIHRTIITHIRPMAYYRAIVENTEYVQEEELSPDSFGVGAEA